MLDQDIHGSIDEQSLNRISEKIIGAAYRVSNVLGCGFLEKVYENAMVVELKRIGSHVLQQYPIPVYYEGVLVGDYYADLFVDNTVIVELKTVEQIHSAHIAKSLNYLKGSKATLCLLINFERPRVEVKRLRL